MKNNFTFYLTCVNKCIIFDSTNKINNMKTLTVKQAIELRTSEYNKFEVLVHLAAALFIITLGLICFGLFLIALISLVTGIVLAYKSNKPYKKAKYINSLLPKYDQNQF